MNERRAVVCLMPTKNESWILDRSLAAAATWADVIVVADQASSDGSQDIVKRHSKAVLIENRSATFDEGARQRLLVEAARRIVGPGAVLVAIDADELLSANVVTSREWLDFCSAPPGTFARIPWVNLSPNFERGWTPPSALIMALVDDGRAHVGALIHSTRLPVGEEELGITFADIRALHYQYVDQERLRSKHRWYQCWERLNAPERRAIAIYRQYHHMDAVPAEQFVTLRPEWFESYEQNGIPVREAHISSRYWWDDDVLQWVKRYGAEYFRRLDIWHEKERWDPADAVADPRSIVDRAVLVGLRGTQAYASRLPVRVMQRAARLAGW
jgi:glycosyltransferase involved in cell wall biosynthesis